MGCVVNWRFDSIYIIKIYVTAWGTAVFATPALYSRNAKGIRYEFSVCARLMRCPRDWPLWICISLQRQISCCVVFRHYLILCLFEFFSPYLCLWLHYSPDCLFSLFLICSPTGLSFISGLVWEERLSFCWTVTASNPQAERTTQSHWNTESSHKGRSFVSELQTFPADT